MNCFEYSTKISKALGVKTKRPKSDEYVPDLTKEEIEKCYRIWNNSWINAVPEYAKNQFDCDNITLDFIGIATRILNNSHANAIPLFSVVGYKGSYRHCCVGCLVDGKIKLYEPQTNQWYKNIDITVEYVENV